VVLAQNNLVPSTAAGFAGQVLERRGGGAAELERGLSGERVRCGLPRHAVGAKISCRVREWQRFGLAYCSRGYRRV